MLQRLKEDTRICHKKPFIMLKYMYLFKTLNICTILNIQIECNAPFLVSCPGPEFLMFTPFSEIPGDDDDDFLNVTILKARYL